MNNLILIGMMGCGKSTVGRLAAEKLGLAFVDTDERIERASGRTIPEIFASDRKSTRLNSSHEIPSRMPSSA